MTKLEKEWIERCKSEKDDLIIIVDNDINVLRTIKKGRTIYEA